MPFDRVSRASRLLVLVAVAIAAAWGGSWPGAAQAPPAAAAIQAAAAALERDGYVATISFEGGGATGEVRYQSSSAFSLLITGEDGSSLEYILLDPDLYSRRRAAGSGVWSGWARRTWHPDAPITGLETYHPRVPLELLRAAVALRDAGTGMDAGLMVRRIDGESDFAAAVFAAYGEEGFGAAGPLFSAQGTWPLRVELDGDGRVRRMELTVPPSEAGLMDGGALVYTFEATTAPVTLAAPAESTPAADGLQAPPRPEAATQTLPLTMQGSGRTISTPPFSVTMAGFEVKLDPAIPDLQYVVYRIKRDRQLFAAAGSLTGGGGVATLPLPLPPGEYVLQIELPRETDWTLTVTPMSAAPAAP